MVARQRAHVEPDDVAVDLDTLPPIAREQSLYAADDQADNAEHGRAHRRGLGAALRGQQAAEKLLQAAETLSQRPEAMQLRYLQTLTQIAGDKTSTIVFPVPVDVIGPILEAANRVKLQSPGGPGS